MLDLQRFRMLNFKPERSLLLPAAMPTPSIDAAVLRPRVIAHTVETSGSVGATFHIEPNDTPRAGEVSLAWFALTQPGGKLIPLAQCDCKLQVKPVATTGSAPTPLSPPLEVVTAERYDAIPGAKITFPQAGTYQLTLEGEPQAEASFEPFRLTYTVNVLPGTASSETIPAPPVTEFPRDTASEPTAITPSTTSSEIAQESTSTAATNGGWGWAIALGVILASIGLLLWMIRHRPKS